MQYLYSRYSQIFHRHPCKENKTNIASVATSDSLKDLVNEDCDVNQAERQQTHSLHLNYKFVFAGRQYLHTELGTLFLFSFLLLVIIYLLFRIHVFLWYIVHSLAVRVLFYTVFFRYYSLLFCS